MKVLKNKLFWIEAMILSLMNQKMAFASGNDAAKELLKILTNDKGTGLMDITQKAGWVIVAFGLGQMIFAFKEENADAKARASMVLLAGVFLITIKEILIRMGILQF